ncbi:MAG: hypothetical protein KDK50_05290 [Chlamydiia bacterium]|nr:hypothetical protein [Chlamydiia bacterium]
MTLVAHCSDRKRSVLEIIEALDSNRPVFVDYNRRIQKVVEARKISPSMVRCNTSEGEEVCVLERSLSTGLQRVILDSDPFANIGKIEGTVVWIKCRGKEHLARIAQIKDVGLSRYFICERPAREGGLYGGRFFFSQLELDFNEVHIDLEKAIPRNVSWPSEPSVIEQMRKSCRDTVIKASWLAGKTEFLRVDSKLPTTICCTNFADTFTYLPQEDIKSGNVVIDLASKTDCSGLQFFPEKSPQRYRLEYETSKVRYARP